LENSVIPVLRKADIKFINPAESDIQAKANITTETKTKAEEQLKKIERTVITVPVEVMDQNGTITMNGTYEWFVQKI